MFTTSAAEKSSLLTSIVDKLLRDREFAELKDNHVSIGIFLFRVDKPTNIGGKIQIATPVEQHAGYDVIIYINDHWVTYAKDIDIEAFVYQLLLSITPVIVGKDNTCVIKIDKEKGINICPETIKKYGKGIKWYKELYATHPGEYRDED